MHADRPSSQAPVSSKDVHHEFNSKLKYMQFTMVLKKEKLQILVSDCQLIYCWSTKILINSHISIKTIRSSKFLMGVPKVNKLITFWQSTWHLNTKYIVFPGDFSPRNTLQGIKKSFQFITVCVQISVGKTCKTLANQSSTYERAPGLETGSWIQTQFVSYCDDTYCCVALFTEARCHDWLCRGQKRN